MLFDIYANSAISAFGAYIIYFHTIYIILSVCAGQRQLCVLGKL